MSDDAHLLEESAEDLWEHAPCGYLSCRPDGTIVRVNATFEDWTGRRREDVVGRRFVDLLTPAGRIYHETHYAPLLTMQGEVREIALDLVCGDGSRLPTLVNSVLRTGAGGEPEMIRITVFDARDRRRYEEELLRARRHEHEMGLELQRSLLSGERPAAPGLEIGVYYRPAITDLEVGGDWHDAFWLSEETVALVIGDVVGRGLTAAATMGQLRSAVRALASTGLEPGALLEALDRFSARHDVGRVTTLVYAELHLPTRELRYAAAGHPPPVVLAPGQRARYLQDGRSVPIAAYADPGPRPDACVTLEPGGGLLLYTDGLIELRTRPLDVSLDMLLEEIEAAPAPLSLPALARRFEDRAHPDDVCLLSARLTDV